MNKNKISGIYVIKNKINSKVYVGSSKSVYYRWAGQHKPRLKKSKHENVHLQHAWDKYGENNFEFLILEECEASALLAREEYWIEHYKSWDRKFGYNLSRIIEGRTITTLETRQKMSKATKKNWKDGGIRVKRIEAIKESVTDETRQKLSIMRKEDWEDPEYKKEKSKIMKDTWNKKKKELKTKLKSAWQSENTRKRHQESCTKEKRKLMGDSSRLWWEKQSKPVLQLTKTGELVKEWQFAKDAAKKFGPHIFSVLTGKRKVCKGYIFKYKEL
jgi:group I intron endonuclease